jgi:O-antigen/teichoic acid export membrane protein
VTADPDVQSSTEAQGQLAQKATRAFGWSFLNTVVSRLGTVAIGVVLARLLGPESFGTFAVATVAMLAMLSFNELGVSLAIVRWKDDPAHIAPTVNSISVLSSLLLFGVVVLTAPAFASAMGDPEATNVVRLMSVAIVINGAVAGPAALLQREFKQGRRMAIDQVNTWLGAVVSLGLALTGLGAMSLAIGRIAGSLVSGVMFLIWSPLRYRFGFNPPIARALLRFGLPLAGASMIVFAVGYADQLVTGAVLGSTALGFYVLAFSLSSWPVSIFSQPLRSVAPAAFARLQGDPKQMNQAFADVLTLLSAVALPSCLLLAGASTAVIDFVYGADWAPSAVVLSYLGLMAVARILFELAYDFLVIKGQSSSILLVQLLWLSLLVPALIVGASFAGLRGVAIAQTAVAILVVLPAYALLLRRAGQHLKSLARQVLPALLVGLTVAGLTHLISSELSSAFLACVLSGLIGLVGVIGLLASKKHVIARFRSLRGQALAT